MTKFEEIEYEVLKYAGIPAVPEPMDPDDEDERTVWSLAVASVLNRNGEKSYAIVRNNFTSHPPVVKAFDPYGVAKITGIHPYEFTSIELPNGVKNVADFRNYISRVYGVSYDRVENLGMGKLMKLYQNYCVKKDAVEKEHERKREEAAAARKRATMKKNKEYERRNQGEN